MNITSNRASRLKCTAINVVSELPFNCFNEGKVGVWWLKDRASGHSASQFVLTVLKLWKRLMLCGGGGVSMGNCKKDFRSR